MAKLYYNDNKCFVFRDLKDCDQISKEIENRFRIYEIDEIIAEPIKMLNNKGYKTESSCSSHYIKDASIQLIKDNYKYDGSYEILDIKNFNGNDYELSLYDEQTDVNLYIQFDNSIKINYAPPGWNYNEEYNSISVNVSTNNYMGYLNDLFKNLISLVNWIESLEEITIDE